MGLILQVGATGIAIGAVYGLLAICFSLVYRLTGVVHFALGEIAGLAAFTTLLVAQGVGIGTAEPSVAGWLAGALVAVAVTTAVGAGVYLVAIRPFLDGRSPVGWIGGTIAAAVLLRGLVAATFTRPSYLFRDPIPFANIGRGGLLSVGDGATIPVRAIFVAAAGMALAFLAARLLDHTHVGKGLRGVTQDRTAAALAGVPIDRYLLVAFAAVGTLAAIAALIALPSTPISVDTGTLLGLKGLVAAAVARFSLPRAAMVAGVALGVVETAIANIHFAGFSSGPSLSDVIPFALLLAILVVRSLRTREVQVA